MTWDGRERRVRELAFGGMERRRERSIPGNIARMKDEEMLARMRQDRPRPLEYPEATEFLED
ncbi:MAG TPA: hypothetical protein VJ570_09055 [Holophagaceae bacterium]|nr:hypothetical protein [Holophagaceae bacterium]